jgi:heme-degrading monooxygenase HmoA
MLLRIIRGNVVAGREADFIAICREQVAGGARSPGLAAFFCGYQRNDGVDRFVIASVWETEEDAVHAGGERDNPRIVKVARGVATISSADYYSAFEPIFRGIVDAPGGVIRLTSARVSREQRQQMLDWLRSQPRQRMANTQRLLLGWSLAERELPDGDGVEVVAISAWPSSLVIEAASDPGRSGAPLYADLDTFAADSTVEQFRAIALELPESLSDVTSRRLIAARFEAREQAEGAARALSHLLAGPRGAHINVAPLGAPGTASDDLSYVLVARVALDEYARAERMMSDEGGEVILNQREEIEDAATDLDANAASFGSPYLAPGLSASQ